MTPLYPTVLLEHKYENYKNLIVLFQFIFANINFLFVI